MVNGELRYDKFQLMWIYDGQMQWVPITNKNNEPVTCKEYFDKSKNAIMTQFQPWEDPSTVDPRIVDIINTVAKNLTRMINSIQLDDRNP